MNQNQDEQHLQILSIFHYLVGGLIALIACFPLIHLVIGISVVVIQLTDPSLGNPPLIVGLIFILFAAVFIFFGWAFAACVVFAGVFLMKRRHYLFCLVMAALLCMFNPFGTVLGVFTILTLVRPSVKEQFEARASGAG